jgi:hypothetical protein
LADAGARWVPLVHACLLAAERAFLAPMNERVAPFVDMVFVRAFVRCHAAIRLSA